MPMTLDRWLAVIGIMVTAFITWWVTYHYYRRSTKKSIPTFVRQSSKMLADSGITKSGFSLLCHGQAVGKSGVTETQIYFWNSGTSPILESDILESYAISLAVPILRSSVLKLSRKVVGLKVVPRESVPNVLTLQFAILEPGDGATIQVIYDGPPETTIECTGACVGAARPTILPANFVRSKTPTPAIQLRSGLQAMLYIVSPLVVFFVGRWSIHKMFGDHGLEIAETVIGITFVVFFFVMICAAVWSIFKRIKAPYVPPDIKP